MRERGAGRRKGAAGANRASLSEPQFSPRTPSRNLPVGGCVTARTAAADKGPPVQARSAGCSSAAVGGNTVPLERGGRAASKLAGLTGSVRELEAPGEQTTDYGEQCWEWPGSSRPPVDSGLFRVAVGEPVWVWSDADSGPARGA